MSAEGIRHVGDGLLEIFDERLLQSLLSKDDINEMYDVEQTPFARGKFAAVRRAVHKKTGIKFAAKFLRRRRRAQCWAKEIGHEIAVLTLCADSPYIVQLHGVYETRNETALLLELATGGELQAILDDEGALTEAQTRFCTQEVLKALQFLHKKSVAHLDLKPQNILLCGAKVEDGLKLCDFGISRVVEEGGKVREILGTPDYVAPEVLQYEPLSIQTDIWSMGVLAYVLLSGCSPFGGDTKQETFLNISQCNLTFPVELFEDVSPAAIDFIRCALRVKPEDRLTVAECLQHRWFIDHPVRSLVVKMMPHKNNKSPSDDDDHHPQQQYSGTDQYADHANNANHALPQLDTLTHDRRNDTNSTSKTDVEQNKENISISNGRVTACNFINVINVERDEQQKTIALRFPNGGLPSTPKVIRKASESSPSTVKTLVKKFQLDIITTAASPSTVVSTTSSTVATSTAASTAAAAAAAVSTSSSSDSTEDFCSTPRCSHAGSFISSQSIGAKTGLEQGIIC